MSSRPPPRDNRGSLLILTAATAGYTYALVLFARVPGRFVAVAVASASLAAVGSVGITASATWVRSWRTKSKQERRAYWRRLRAQIGQQLLRLVVLIGQLLRWLVVLIGQLLRWLVVLIGQLLRWLGAQIRQRLAARTQAEQHEQARTQAEQHEQARTRAEQHGQARTRAEQHREEHWEE